jgi:hypothetical protein
MREAHALQDIQGPAGDTTGSQMKLAPPTDEWTLQVPAQEPRWLYSDQKFLTGCGSHSQTKWSRVRSELVCMEQKDINYPHKSRITATRHVQI